jgi:hypothetical protein
LHAGPAAVVHPTSFSLCPKLVCVCVCQCVRARCETGKEGGIEKREGCARCERGREGREGERAPGAACLSLSTSRRPDHSPPKAASGRESWRRGRAREAGWDSSRQAASLPESEASKSARLERRERVSGGQVGTRGGREGTSTPGGAVTQAHLGVL